MGEDGFSWFVGVVEDRNDLEQLGRVRVRVLGLHSDSLTKIKTTDLPWAHVMHPVTDPSMQGLGHTPSFLTQGSWVIGFFRDNEKQQPVIMGSLPGIPFAAADPTKGFNDPRGDNDRSQDPFKPTPTFGPYPGIRNSGHDVGESDTNRLARGTASEGHQSLIDRRDQRLRGDPADLAEAKLEDDLADYLEATKNASGIPTATKPYLLNVSTAPIQEDRGFWEEPDPKGIIADANPYISSAYPYNHVFESESGHITEVDDSPGAERMFRQHTAGTFEEIHPDGSMVTKIVGNNYEIVIKDENIVIKGSQNITVEGSVRELIKGDYIQEIEGDFYRKVHGNERVKIGAKLDADGESVPGNREEEIVGNYAFNINEDVNGNVHGDVWNNIDKTKWELVGGQYCLQATGKIMDSNEDGTGIYITSLSDYVLNVKGNLSESTRTGIFSMKALENTLNMKSIGMTIHSEDGDSIKYPLRKGTLSLIVGNAWTSTTGTTWDHTSIGAIEIESAGDITIDGGPNIHLNPSEDE